MVRLDPQYRIQFGMGGQLDCTPNIAEMEVLLLAKMCRLDDPWHPRKQPDDGLQPPAERARGAKNNMKHRQAKPTTRIGL